MTNLDKSKIPIGMYCYDKNGICPYWSIDKTKPYQENGYCAYLKKGDWDINNEGGIIYDVKTGKEFEVDYFPFGGLLWDQVKECKVNCYEEWCLDCKYIKDINSLSGTCIKFNKIVDVVNWFCNNFEPKEK